MWGDLVIYGLTEAMDAAGNQLGSPGLLGIARTLPAGPPGEIALGLLAGVDAFRGAGPRRDDATVVVLRRVAQQPASLPAPEAAARVERGYLSRL